MTAAKLKERLAQTGQAFMEMEARRKLYYAVPVLAAFHLGNRLPVLARLWYLMALPGGGAWWLRCAKAVLLRAMPSLNKKDLLTGLFAACLAAWALRIHEQASGNGRTGQEYGSARWGTARDIRPFIHPDFYSNVLLTKTERLSMESRPKDPATARNKNVLVIGGSGSGKTRFHVKPELMQMHSSYVVTDPKGTLVGECGMMLARHGYRIRVFNTVDFKKSMGYNPFAYIRSEKDILKLATVLMENTSQEGAKGGDPFWASAEKLLLCAMIGYVWYEAPPEEQNIATVLELVNMSEVREDDPDYRNPVDRLFDELEEENGSHFAVRQYRRYKLAAGKTAKSILISCGARLAVFDIEEVRRLTGTDEMAFERIGTERTALFIIVSDTDTTFNFLAAMLYSQLFNHLCELADGRYGGRLPVHVEFANIGKIPDFDKLIATVRSREISVSIILQAVSQLKTMYKDAAATIEGNCDTMLFLGGKEASTLKEISALLGKRTVTFHEDSDTRGSSPAFSRSSHRTGRELMTADELSVMDGGRCVLQIRGVRPFLSEKYDILSHPRYGELADADKRNLFDVEAYVRMHCVLTGDEEAEVFETGGGQDG